MSMSESLRNRLWMTLQQFNRSFYYQPDPNDNWNQQTDFVDETERRLESLLGRSPLKAKTIQGEEKIGIEAYFKSGFPSCALEVVEQFAAELKAHDFQDAVAFQGEVNDGYFCPTPRKGLIGLGRPSAPTVWIRVYAELGISPASFSPLLSMMQDT